MLAILPELLDRPGGIQTYCQCLLRSLVRYAGEDGANVIALTQNDRAQAEPPEPVLGFGKASVRGFARRRLPFLWAVFGALITRPDVVIVAHINMTPLAALATVMTGRRPFVVIYGIEAWRPLPAFTRWVLRHCRILSISDYTKCSLTKLNGIPPSQVALLPCAVSIHDVTPPSDSMLSDEAFRILTVARLHSTERDKGIDHVLAAVRDVAGEIPIRYEVVGDGDDAKRLRELAKSYGIGDLVTFAGRLSRKELLDAYRRASLFVMPSKKEGFGIVYLEAACFSIPSVACAEGGVPEVVIDGQTGFLVNFGDSARIANIFRSLARDRKQLLDLGVAASQRLKNEFSEEALYERLCGLLTEHWHREESSSDRA